MTTVERPAGNRTGLVVAAVVTAVTTTLVILVWGFVALPAFPSLTDQPDASIAGEIAYLTQDDRGVRSCLMVAAASGQAQRELRCFDGERGDWVDQVGWTNQGEIVVFRYGPSGPQFETLDAVTGQTLASGSVSDNFPLERIEAPDAVGDGIRVDNVNRGVRVTVDVNGEQRVVLDMQAPQRYSIWEIRWSPDRQHLLAVDSENRILILSLSGDEPGRILVEDARSATWFIEGVGADQPVDLNQTR